ncbi:DUF7742 family protein [Antarctobacter jejuensis]|uniref:DUF7742 family protein n=1 Tax=Antarctobacter jejuensis TaxID=1439938 RepID=UPI003FD59FD2
MRPLLPGDVCAAARVLLAVPAHARDELALRLLTEASAADRYCREHNKAHPRWGNGTLSAAAFAHDMGHEKGFGDRDFLDCQARVIRALLSRHPEAQATQRIAVGSSSSRRGAMLSPQSSQ